MRAIKGTFLFVIGILLTLWILAWVAIPRVLLQHQNEIIARIEHVLQLPVQISKMDVQWRGSGPHLQLHQVTVLNPQKTAKILQIQSLDLGINIWYSLLLHKLSLTHINISGSYFKLMQLNDGQTVLLGLQSASNSNNTENVLLKLLDWLSVGHRVRLKNVYLDWYSKEGKIIRFMPFEITITRVGDSFTLQSGSLSFDSAGMRIDFGKFFKAPLSLQQVKGNIHWQRTNTGWFVQIKPITLANQEGKLLAKLNMAFYDDGSSPMIDLQGSANLYDPKRIKAYWPLPLLSPKLIQWLDNAFIDARDVLAQITLHGRLQDFPYDSANGQFKVNVKVDDLHLHYAEHWPDLLHVKGELQFVGRKLTMHINKGKIFNSDIVGASAIIPEIHKSNPAQLQLHGKVKGDLADLQAYLQQSPIKDKGVIDLSTWRLSGNSQLTLTLNLPIGQEKTDWHVAGKLSLQGAAIQLANGSDFFNALTGDINFSDRFVVSDVITGNFLGQPMVISIKSRDLNTDVVMLAQGEPSKLLKYFAIDLSSQIQGSTSYEAVLHLNSNHINSLEIKSNLKGIKIDLPNPLKKEESQAIAFSASAPINNLKQWQFKYGDRIMAAIRWLKDDQGIHLERGRIHLGNKLVNLPSISGLTLTGKLANLDLQQWHAFKEQQGILTMSDVLRAFDINLDKLILAGQSFTNIQLQGTKGKQAWNIAIANSQIQGRLSWPLNFPSGTLQGQLSKLYLSSFNSFSNKSAWTMQDISNVDLSIDDFQYANKRFGALSLKLMHKGNDELLIKQLDSIAPSFKITTSGVWQASAIGNHCYLAGKLSSNDAAATLQSLGLEPYMASQDASLIFNLDWMAEPWNLNLTNLNGQLKLQAGQGRLLHFARENSMQMDLGRLLSLLSMQTLSRRLQLDFTDLTSTGFSFDQLYGDITLKDGKAISSNITIDGPVALLELKGHIDLIAENQDLQIKVTPYVTSSLPVIAALAGGPVAGAVTWAADRLLGSQVQKIVTTRYHVTGSWDKPRIIEESY